MKKPLMSKNCYTKCTRLSKHFANGSQNSLCNNYTLCNRVANRHRKKPGEYATVRVFARPALQSSAPSPVTSSFFERLSNCTETG
jgi:hypothetical protein